MPTHPMKTLSFLVLASLLLLGCTQPPSQKAQEIGIPVTQPILPASQPASQEWANYDNIGISFDYPKGMGLTESLQSYPGYATVVLQSENASEASILVLVFMNGSSENITDPIEEVSGIMASDSESENDPLGILHQATSKSPITTYTSSNGLATAEIGFNITHGNLSLYGYAFTLYNKDTKGVYGVRMVSLKNDLAVRMKERFLSSFN